MDGKLTRDKYQCINKCGHALHTDDEVFKDFCNDPRIKSIVSQLGYQKPTVIQTMFIFKPPRIGGAVLAHQGMSNYIMHMLRRDPQHFMALPRITKFAGVDCQINDLPCLVQPPLTESHINDSNSY